MLVLDVVIWVLLPFLNFLYWLDIGEEAFISGHLRDCHLHNDSPLQVPGSRASAREDHASWLAAEQATRMPPHFSSHKGKAYQKHRENRIVEFHNYAEQNRVINFHPDTPCRTVVNHLAWSEEGQCLAVVSSSSAPSTLLLQRFNSRPAGTKKEVAVMYKNPPGGPYRSSGFFTKGGNAKGRRRFREKIGPLAQELQAVEGEILDLLAARRLLPGADITVLVTNDGQMDLFMNFACSCRHHSIPLENIVVFGASKEIVPLISSTGAIGIFHEQFASASRKSSGAYLDAVFVDMMWYKAFSVWLILKLGFNVLFQDVDIIWFKDPFPYFQAAIRDFQLAHPGKTPPEAFLSDDGQRTTVRYSPFYANSGFYYLVSGPKTVNLAWEIMTTFDVMQSSGSHQNVFTMKLMEALDFGPLHTQSLHLHNFSNGATFHHEKRYFAKIRSGEAVPYMFHMCWTANKADKLKYLKESSMWYLSEKHGAADLLPGGALSSLLVSAERKRPPLTRDEVWATVAAEYCHAVPGAP